MKDKNKISFKLRKNDLRLKYYRNHFSDHPIIYYLYGEKLIVSLNVELYTQSLNKIKYCNLSNSELVDFNNNKFVESLQKLFNDFPMLKK